MIKNKSFLFSTLTIIAVSCCVSFKNSLDGVDTFQLQISSRPVRQSRDLQFRRYMVNNITTSKIQANAMLASIVNNDKKKFDSAYQWSKNNLQRKDKLFSSLWGKDVDGKYKTLDYNSATGADIDIAYALIRAYEKWDKYQYLLDAIPIINAIWTNETQKVGNYLVIMPGSEHLSNDEIEVNPSYFAPYAFKYFQKYDELHDWNYLVDSSYYYLNTVMAKTKNSLPPNWFLIKDKKIVLENSERGNFSNDAATIFARVYLDYTKTGEKRALPILAKSRSFIEKWKNSQNFYVNYQASGHTRNKNELISSINVLIPTMSLYDKKTVKQLYEIKVEPFFNIDKSSKHKKHTSSKRSHISKDSYVTMIQNDNKPLIKKES